MGPEVGQKGGGVSCRLWQCHSVLPLIDLLNVHMLYIHEKVEVMAV